MRSFHRTVLTFFVIALILLSLGGVMSSGKAESLESLDEDELETPYFPKPDGSPWPPHGGKSNVYANATGWETSVTFDDTDVPVENDIDLKTHIETVQTGGETYNAHIYVTAISTSQWDLDTGYSETEMAHLEEISISAEQCFNSHGNDFTIDWKETNNCGENLADEEDDGEAHDKQEEITTDLILGGLDELNPVPIGLLDALGEARKYYFSEYYNADSSIGIGPGTAELTFEPENMPGLYNTDDKSFHIASSKIDWELPHCQIDSEHTLTISAKNILQHTEIVHNIGETETEEVGAETSVDITIKNAEIESVESENEGTNTHLSTDKYAQLSDVVSVELNNKGFINDPDDGYGPNSLGDPEEIPKIDLIVDWGDGDGSEFLKEDWEPYYWEYMDYNSWKSVDKELSISNTYNLEAMGINPGDCETISVEITAEVHQEYGGWEETIDYEVTLEREENDDDDDDGGGGSGGNPDPPPRLPWGDDT